MAGGCSSRIGALLFIALAAHFLMCHAAFQFKCVDRENRGSITGAERDFLLEDGFKEVTDEDGFKILVRTQEYVPAFHGPCPREADCDAICSGLKNAFEDFTTKLKGICGNDDEVPGAKSCACCVVR